MTWDDALARTSYENDIAAWSVWPFLSEHVSDWRAFIEEYWGLAGRSCPNDLKYDQWEMVRHLGELAEPLLSCAQNLALPNSTEQQSALGTLRASLRRSSTNAVTAQILDLTFASQALQRLRGAGTRATRLLGQVQARHDGDRSADYIRRATLLYLSGFEPEAAIMCRAALDHALRRHVRERDLIQTNDDEGISLDGLLRICGESGVLPGRREPKGNSRRSWDATPKTPLWYADQVRRAGNFAAHEQASFRPPDDGLKDAFEVIRALSKVLDHLALNQESD